MIVGSILVTNLAILVLAGFVGFEVISKVPNTLHTPLMSGTNAIHGIVMLGGLLVIGLLGQRRLQQRDPRDRDRLRHDQRRRRLPRHRPHARDVQDQAEGQGGRRRRAQGQVIALPLATTFLQNGTSSTSSTSSPSPSSSTGCAACPARRPPCAATASPRSAWRSPSSPRCCTERGQLGPDRARRGDRHRGRRPCGPPGEDDRDAADGRAVQRRRRRRGVPDRLVGVPPHQRLYGRAAVRRDPLAVRGDRRLGLLLGLEHRFRQAAGDPARAPDHARRGPAGINGILLVLCLAAAIDIAAGDHSQALFIGLLVPPRSSATPSCCRSAAPTCPSSSRCSTPSPASPRPRRARARQHGADRRRHDRRRLGHDPHQPDGQGDEPLDPVHRRRRVRRRRRVEGAAGAGEHAGSVRSTTASDAAILLAYASRVVIVPGYGMAVAQAQHAVRELTKELESAGCRGQPTRSTRSPGGCRAT